MEGHSLVALSQSPSFILFGGRGADGRYLDTLWRLDLSLTAGAIAWTPLNLGPGPTPRAYHAACLWQGAHMVVCGGVSDCPASIAGDEVWLLEPISARWRRFGAVGEIPEKRCHHTLSAASDRLYLYGGYPVGDDPTVTLTPGAPPESYRDFFDVYELSDGGGGAGRWTWRRIRSSTQLPPMLWGHSALIYLQNLVVFGGVDVVDSREANTVCVWHCERQQWRWVEFTDAPAPRALHAAAGAGGEMIVLCGFGEANSRKYADVWKFGLQGGRWQRLQPGGQGPSGRSGLAAAAIPVPSGGHGVLATGGANSAGERDAGDSAPCASWWLDLSGGGQWYRLADSIGSLSVPGAEPPVAGQPAPLPPPIATPPPPQQLAQPQRLHPGAHGAPVSVAAPASPRSASPLGHITPFADDRPPSPRPLAAARSQWPGQPPPQPTPPRPRSDSPRRAPCYVSSQSVQTLASGDSDGQARAGTDELIRQQQLEIEQLRLRVTEMERAQQEPRSDPFLSLAAYSVADPTPLLSQSTRAGPDVLLTKTTLADLLPLVAGPRPPALGPDTTARARAVAAPIAERRAAAAAAGGGAVGSAAQAASLEHRWVREPHLLPTAPVDPTAPAPDPTLGFPGAMHSGVAPAPAPAPGACAAPHSSHLATAPHAPRTHGGQQPWGDLVIHGPPGDAPPGGRPPARALPQRRHRSPTLRQLASGRASMLSITHVPQLQPPGSAPPSAEAP
eukprot:TRINITY_DN55673_c0_g1_i2.p1 TRINITY_DN55673_c0_g1~~TRINITY_DN55673_c0_g1_i2.p1  ORF type:complete len:755 (+),score=183.84 TRINITY_DN55673_c0_g1_i2:78-2267(+)